MNYFEIGREVFEIEKNALNEVGGKLNSNFNAAIEAILNCNGRCVITGMGKSGLVGKKIAATLASTGTRSFFMHPGEAYHGDLGMIDPNDVIIAISNSGETDEVAKLLSFFKDNQNKVIAMTGNSDSTLAKYADFFLDIGISKEACPLELAPTSSTTVTMAMGDAIAVALMKARNFQPENFARFHPGGSLGRKLLTKVSDVMVKNNLPVVSKEAKFESVIDTITQGRLGIVLVSEDGKKLDGVITDGDIRRALSDFGGNIISASAKDFLTKSPKTIHESEKLVVAEEYMQENKISNLIVTNEEMIVGILQIYNL